MTLTQMLEEEMKKTGDTDVSTRARMSTNEAGRKLYQIGDYLKAKKDDIFDANNNEKIDDGRVDAAWNQMFKGGDSEVHHNYVYDPVNDTYINMSPSNHTASDLVYMKDKLEKEAKADDETLYDIHYGDKRDIKIGVTGYDDANKRHPRATAKGGIIEQAKIKDARFMEHELKKYGMDKDANTFKAPHYDQLKEGMEVPNTLSRDGENNDFNDYGLAKGKSEVFQQKKILESLPDIAAAIDTAKSPEEKAVLQHKFELLQERTLKNQKTNSKMKFLSDFRAQKEKEDEANGGTLSPKGFGNFRELLEKDNRIFEAYKDLYNQEDTTGDLNDKPRSMQTLMIEQFMSEKSNQIQEAIEDLKLSKNESAIMSDLLGIYRASDLTPGQATQAAANSVFDPANLAPAALAGKIAKVGGKAIDAVSHLFGKGTAKTSTKQVVAGAAGGGVSTGVEDVARQQVDVNAQKKDEIDWKQAAISTAAGATVGGAIVKGLQVVSDKVGNLLKSKGVEESTSPEDLSTKINEVRQDKSLTPEEQLELDKYEYEIMQSSESKPQDYKEVKTLAGTKDKSNEIADAMEAEAEIEVASSVKPEVPREKEPTPIEKEKEEESETKKITLHDETTNEDVELDLGTTNKSTRSSVMNLKEEDRLPFAKEFILGKKRVKRVGDDTDTADDIALNSPMQVHKTGRGVNSAAVDKPARTVDQEVKILDTPEASVNNVMKSYNLAEAASSLDPDKRILKHISEMEHRVLAIEGMKSYYRENNIDGDFTKLDAMKNELIQKIEERTQNIYDAEVDFKSKADVADENLPSSERAKEIQAIADRLTNDKEIMDVPEFMKVVKQLTDYTLGQRILQRIKQDGNDRVMPEDINQRTPVIDELQRILNAKDSKGQPLSPKKVRDKIQEVMPKIVKKILSNANDDASKIVALNLIDKIDKAAGFKRQQGKIVTKPEPKKTTDSRETPKEKTKKKDASREQVIKEWKEHNPGKEEAKLKKALATDRYEDNDGLLEGVKGEIYAMLKQKNLTPRDRTELTEALVHKEKHDFTKSPLELTKEKKEKYIQRKNSEESKRIFNQELTAKNVTQITSVRELFDAASQVAQIVGAFFGDIKMFKAVGATKDSIGTDYRVVIGEALQKEGIIGADVKKVKDIIKVPTRNVTYLEGRSSAIKGMMEELSLPYDKAARIYDGIIRKLETSDAGGLLQYANKIADNVENENIPPQFDLILPDGRKIKVDARESEEVPFRLFGTEWKSKKKTDKAKPGTVAATIVQSLDSFIKDSIIKKMSNYDGITVHDGFAFKTDAQKAEATKLYFEALKRIHEENYLNETLHRISNGKIPLEKVNDMNWDEVIPDKLFSPEFKQGVVDTHEIRTNMSLNSDRLLKPTEMLASLLNESDPSGKLGFSGMRHSIVRYLSKSTENQNNPKTYLSNMDAFVAKVLSAESIESMHELADNWKKQWMAKNKVRYSKEVDDSFEKLTNMIRATAESIPEFSNNKLMEREQFMNQFARIYFKNLAESKEIAESKSIEKNIGKDVEIETIIHESEPEQLHAVMDTVRESIEETNSKEVPTMAEEKAVVEADGPPLDETIETDGAIKKTFDEAYLAIRKILNAKKITEADISHATHNAVEKVKNIFQQHRVNKDKFKQMVLDSGYRHIRGMTKEQADRFVKLHKGTAEKYAKYIDAKARAHTNPNMRYGYFRNNMFELVMEKESLSSEAAAVRANAILKLSAIKNMTDEHWAYVSKDSNKIAAKEFLDIIDIWDGVAKESVFKTGKTNFNDSYLATVRSKGAIDLDDVPESKLLDNNTLGKLIDDELTLKHLNETPNQEGYMENHKIRRVGEKFYRILVDERAEQGFMKADPVDILSKTVFTTMAKVVGSDEMKNTRSLLKESAIFSNEKTKDTRPLTKEDKEFLAEKAKIDVDEISATHVNIELGRQIFPKKVWEPMGQKTHAVLKKITQDFKYNVVPINPNSGINGALWSIFSVVGRHPIKGIPALFKATSQLKDYKKLDNKVKEALQSGNMIEFEKALEARSKSEVFQAISDGMTINALDGVTVSHSILKGASEKVFGKDTKALHIARTIFLRPHTPVANQLIGFFSLSDSIGRMASYNVLVGTKHDTGVGAGIKANATFGDMAHVSHPMIEGLDQIPVTAFIKWGERTFTEILKLPRAQQLTLIGSGLLITNGAEEFDIEDKGFNPLRTFAEIPDDFIISPVVDNYNKYQGETSAFEHAVRATTQFVLPSTYNRLLMSYIFDTRNGAVQSKIIKLVFPPRGVAYDNPVNGTRISYKGNKIPLTTFDSRPWWEQMMSDNPKKTQEQWDAGAWRQELLESMVGKEQILKWRKENKLIKFERMKAADPAYGPNLF